MPRGFLARELMWRLRSYTPWKRRLHTCLCLRTEQTTRGVITGAAKRP